MNDIATKNIVRSILEQMNLKLISQAVEKEIINLDSVIKYIKHKSKQYSNLVETIDYFL